MKAFLESVYEYVKQRELLEQETLEAKDTAESRVYHEQRLTLLARQASDGLMDYLSQQARSVR